MIGAMVIKINHTGQLYVHSFYFRTPAVSFVLIFFDFFFDSIIFNPCNRPSLRLLFKTGCTLNSNMSPVFVSFCACVGVWGCGGACMNE